MTTTVVNNLYPSSQESVSVEVEVPYGKVSITMSWGAGGFRAAEQDLRDALDLAYGEARHRHLPNLRRKA